MAVYGKRKKQIQELMRAKGVDAMLVAGAENYYYITGDYRRQARMLFYKDADPTIIVFQPEVPASIRGAILSSSRSPHCAR